MGDSYLELKAPWQEVKRSPEAAALTLRTAMNLIHLGGVISEPVIPDTGVALQGL